MSARGRIADRIKRQYAQSGVLTVPECADRLRVHRNTVWRLIHCGSLSHIRIAGRVGVPAAALEAYVVAQTRIGSVA